MGLALAQHFHCDRVARGEFAKRRIQRMIAEKIGHPLRGQHAPNIGSMKLRLEVLKDLPEYARHGLFKPGAVYEGVGRYSNSTSVPSADTDPNAGDA